MALKPLIEPETLVALGAFIGFLSLVCDQMIPERVFLVVGFLAAVDTTGEFVFTDLLAGREYLLQY